MNKPDPNVAPPVPTPPPTNKPISEPKPVTNQPISVPTFSQPMPEPLPRVAQSSAMPPPSYQSLLAEAFNDAEDVYPVDPRVRMYTTRNAGSNNVVTNEPVLSNATVEEVEEESSTMDTLAAPLLTPPSMKSKTSIIVVDTANRDWVKQPDSFSFVFSFGEQLPVNQKSSIQIPYYYNNAVVPFAAYDVQLPLAINLNADTYIQTQRLPNNTPRIIPGSSIPVPAFNGSAGGLTLGQPYGWRLVIDTSGNLKHYNPYNPNNILPSDRIVYFPVYDARETRGQLIGIDTVLQNTNTNLGFSTQKRVTNVTSLRLARATMPIRKFNAYNASVTNNAFRADPYILMYVQNLRDVYYGPTSNIQTAFTALVQQQRTTIDPTTTTLAQVQDYYPWTNEAFTFDPPNSQLSNAVISFTDNLGNVMSHTDDLNIFMMRFSTSTTDTSGGVGCFTCYLTRDINGTVFPDPGFSNYFALNELNIGDSIEVYAPVISQIVNDRKTTPAVATFFTNLLELGGIITAVSPVNLVGTYPLLSLGYSVTAVLRTTNFSNTLAVYSNINNVLVETASNQIPNTIVMRTMTDLSISDFYYPRYLYAQSSFSSNYPLPILNVNMQGTYAFEVIQSEPVKTF